MKSQFLHDAFACARDALYAPANACARDALYAPADAWAVIEPPPAPNYRAFCIAVLELRINSTPELLTALAKRYHLLVDDHSGTSA